MPSATTKRRPIGTGAVRQLPSRRWQARFTGPDGVMRPAPVTFDTKLDATAWLNAQVRSVDSGTWIAPDAGSRPGVRLRQYADTWLAQRELKPRTRVEYRALLDQHILPALGDHHLDAITPAVVRAWYSGCAPHRPTRRAHAYSLLRAIYRTAVIDDLVAANPCRIPNAGTNKKSAHHVQPATLPELEAIVASMPDRYRAMVLLAAWCALRFGELTELRRSDVDLDGGILFVRRGVTRVKGAGFVVGDPKSEAGRRTVAVPPHLIPALRSHLSSHTDPDPGALLFPGRRTGEHMHPGALQTVWYPARDKAGRPDLHFHDLRHTGATLAAATGATIRELMARLGHSTPAAAMRYQHATEDRDRAIAEALSGFAGSTVIPLQPKTRGNPRHAVSGH